MKYDLNSFVEEYRDKDYINILKDLNKEISHLDVLYLKLKSSEYDYGLTEYRQHVGDFLFFLNTGVVPNGIGIVGLRNFLPIVTNLVQKNQLKPSILNLFE
ncbi:hypothetical protein RT99_06645 [Flavobacterium sp. MEB061]|uniref:hypothetical protein n=1 Tax=Flavobacterium sp. MEB061 TaxID=1587524 RepID=UPI0005ACF952|nr:hypothetical protein [Flavobacterium sp. MEB061]KIQ22765.1 hypothetical protein RT99_06645 [Flavobacterium sp. MEB061]